jgi:hypothetical protein
MSKIDWDKIEEIGNRAVKKAQEENRQLSIPNVYSIDGQIVYELPDGSLVTEYKF